MLPFHLIFVLERYLNLNKQVYHQSLKDLVSCLLTSIDVSKKFSVTVIVIYSHLSCLSSSFYNFHFILFLNVVYFMMFLRNEFIFAICFFFFFKSVGFIFLFKSSPKDVCIDFKERNIDLRNTDWLPLMHAQIVTQTFNFWCMGRNSNQPSHWARVKFLF